VIGLVQVGIQAMADRYTYLPQIGILLATVFEARFWVQRMRLRTLAVAAGALALAGCAAVTFHQLQFWATTQALFTHALSVTPNNWGAHAGLAFALEDSSQFPEALKEYQESLWLNPSSAKLYNDIGNMFDKLNQDEEALKYYQETLRLQPRPVAHLNVGIALAKLAKYADAVDHFDEAAHLDPADPRPHIWKAQALLWKGRSADGADELRAAVRLDPNQIESLLQLARVLAADNDVGARNGQESVEAAKRADQLTGGDNPLVLDTLAMAYAECGKFAEARESLQRAIDVLSAAGRQKAAAELQDRMRLYRLGQPYREKFTKD
jgi:tetratricopeptide (TPR) repeat protein